MLQVLQQAALVKYKRELLRFCSSFRRQEVEVHKFGEMDGDKGLPNYFVDSLKLATNWSIE